VFIGCELESHIVGLVAKIENSGRQALDLVGRQQVYE